MRKRRRKRAMSAVLPVLAILLLGVGLLQLQAIFMEYAINLVEDSAAQEINNVISETIGADPTAYYNLITLSYDAEQRVTSLQTNVIQIGLLKTQVVNRLYERLDDLEHTTIGVPLGSVFGGGFLSGMGPEVEIGLVGMGQMSADFFSSFSAAGINQTRHKILIEIHAGVRILTPFGGEDREIVSSFPLTDTVIVGSVPEQYVEIDLQDASQQHLIHDTD